MYKDESVEQWRLKDKKVEKYLRDFRTGTGPEAISLRDQKMTIRLLRRRHMDPLRRPWFTMAFLIRTASLPSGFASLARIVNF